MKEKLIQIEVPKTKSAVSGIMELPGDSTALLVLAHGAGAGMQHVGMATLAKALQKEGIATLRYQFPYMEKGSKRPDFPPVATATVAAAVAFAATETKLPIFAGGRSFGGRMTTTAASSGLIPLAKGIICFGFPLHPAKQPSTTRAEHLADVNQPILMVQGTRDDLSDLQLIRAVAGDHKNIELHILDHADHSYGVLKSSGRTASEVLSEVAGVVEKFCAVHARI